KKDLFASDFVARTRNTKASIPAPFASSDTKISLFAVQSSFARAIFRLGKIRTAGNTGYVFPAVLYEVWAEKSLAKPALSLICTP
ncbi:MAG: hypothetical protein IK101_00005, partial [Oscillospiraceae bacterium]|nr:hypothetical protein [Oscillospiraceae bacterium]